jgi:hypothetical protein
MELFNTSSVPLCYKLHCAGNDADDVSDFAVFPQQGEIKGHESAPIRLQFKPRAIRSYNCEVVVDVENVGDDQLRLPVSAESLVPIVIISITTD